MGPTMETKGGSPGRVGLIWVRPLRRVWMSVGRIGLYRFGLVDRQRGICGGVSIWTKDGG